MISELHGRKKPGRVQRLISVLQDVKKIKIATGVTYRAQAAHSFRFLLLRGASGHIVSTTNTNLINFHIPASAFSNLMRAENASCRASRSVHPSSSSRFTFEELLVGGISRLRPIPFGFGLTVAPSRKGKRFIRGLSALESWQWAVFVGDPPMQYLLCRLVSCVLRFWRLKLGRCKKPPFSAELA